jgi:FlgD Ig-like domain
LTESGGTLDSLRPLLGGMNLSGTKYTDTLQQKFLQAGGLMDYGTQNAPNALLAGSASLSDTLITYDFFGSPRQSKREVGAIEFDQSGITYPLGKVTLKVVTGSDPTKATFQITSRNFDATLADSVVFYYSTLKKPGQSDFQGRGSVGVTTLAGSGISREFTGLSGKQTYYFFAAFGKAGNVNLGFTFLDSAKTGTIQVFPPNTVDIATKPGTIFPDPDGVFTDTSKDFPNWKGTIVFSDTVRTGTVCAPALSAPTTTPGGLDAFAGAPVIKACFENEALGQDSSELSWTLKIDDLAPLPAELKNEHLFAIPATGLPIYVPDWTMTSNGTSSSITINSYLRGTFTFQFGHLNLITNPGQVTPSATTRLDYTVSSKFKDSTFQIPVTIQGLGFRTANPMIFATPIPAGSKLVIGSDPNTTRNPFGKTYFSSIQARSSGVGNLGADLRTAQMVQYFSRMAKVDSAAGGTGSPAKPLTLNPAFATPSLVKAIQIGSSSVTIDATGALSQATVSIPLKYSSRDVDNGGGGATRSVEVYFQVFDGGKISTVSAFIGTKFTNDDLSGAEHADKDANKWHLFSYPWDESLGNDLSRLVGDTNQWNLDAMLAYRLASSYQSGNGSEPVDYELFQGGDASAWGYDSTRALWVASTRKFAPNSKAGQSVDIAPFALPLQASKWTLFGLPFNFPMRWKDVTVNAGQSKGTVFRFLPDTKSWEALDEKSIVFPWQGLAIRPIAVTVLNFPVLDTNRSAPSLAKSAVASPLAWNAKIIAQNNTAAMNLKIGMAKNEMWTSEPPLVPKQNFWVSLVSGTGRASEVIQSEFSGVEGIWPLHVQAFGKSTEAVQLSIQDQTGDLPIYLVDATAQTVTELKQGETISLPVQDADSKQYALVAGESLLPKALRMGTSPFLLHLANFPNPFSTATRIRYELPAQHREVTYTLQLVDMTGRSVFKISLRSDSKLDWLWDGRANSGSVLPAGRYHMTLDAVTKAGVRFHSQRDVLKLR